MKIAFILLIVMSVFAAPDPAVKFSEFKFGGTTLTNVTITKKNPRDAVIRYDGGVQKVEVKNLPEPLRSKWYDEQEVRAYEDSLRPKAAQMKIPPAPEPPKPEKELRAEVSMSLTELHVRNLNRNPWGDLTITIDGSYSCRVRSIRQYETSKIPLIFFTDNNQNRFQPLKKKPLSVELSTLEFSPKTFVFGGRVSD